MIQTSYVTTFMRRMLPVEKQKLVLSLYNVLATFSVQHLKQVIPIRTRVIVVTRTVSGV